jgi:exopolysaccharide biosynthesis protein
MVAAIKNGDRMMRRIFKPALLILCLCALLFSSAAAEGLTPLPMDTLDFGPAPRDENYLSDNEYLDESIHVQIFEGRYADTNYVYAYVKIADPSQFRTVPAGVYFSANATFKNSGDPARGRLVAEKVNAVVAINGDYYTKSNKCQIVMRQAVQYRNIGNGAMDALIVDRNGDFDYIQNVTKQSYADYYEAHKDAMYQVFCFGPVMVLDGKSVIDESYQNGNVGSGNKTQRSAIAQIGELEYLLITTEGPQSGDGMGMTILELAQLCEELGYRFSETGCRLAFNLDGGNSSTLVFKRIGGKNSTLLYTKINSLGIERFLSDLIYFATLVE